MGAVDKLQDLAMALKDSTRGIDQAVCTFKNRFEQGRLNLQKTLRQLIVAAQLQKQSLQITAEDAQRDLNAIPKSVLDGKGKQATPARAAMRDTFNGLERTASEVASPFQDFVDRIHCSRNGLTEMLKVEVQQMQAIVQQPDAAKSKVRGLQ